MKKLLMFLLVFLVLGIVSAQAQDLEYFKVYTPQSGMSADEIMQIKYHNKYSIYAHDYNSTSIIKYIDPSGFTRTKEAIRKRIVLAGENGISYKDLIVVTEPTLSKGLAVLTWTYEDVTRDQDTWLWIPSLKKVRKISASEDDDAFMGSDLTVEEVSTRRLEDEDYSLLREDTFGGYVYEETGETKFEGEACFVIECIPKKPHWYYSKRVIWVSKDTGGNIFEEYYDKNGTLFKTIFRDWIWFDRGDGTMYPIQENVEGKDLRTGHRTIVALADSKYDEGASEGDFTVRILERSKW
ncbi:outer membrane lipoprotein-sorting protein [Candidatus Omnitrophota bacterium]